MSSVITFAHLAIRKDIKVQFRKDKTTIQNVSGREVEDDAVIAAADLAFGFAQLEAFGPNGDLTVANASAALSGKHFVGGTNQIQFQDLYAVVSDGGALDDSATLHKLADSGYGSRLTGNRLIDGYRGDEVGRIGQQADPVSIWAHGRISNGLVGSLQGLQLVGQGLGFNRQTGFGVDNGPESGNRWINDGDAVNFELNPVQGRAQVFERVSFTVDTDRPVARIALDIDGNVLRSGVYGARANAANRDFLALIEARKGDVVVIDFLARTITVGGVVAPHTEAFFAAYGASAERNLLTVGAVDGARFSIMPDLAIVRRNATEGGDVVPPDAPTLALDPASDSGTQGDGITSALRPVFVGTAEPGAVVRLLLDGVEVAQATAGADGKWIAVPASDLPEGAASYAATATDAAGNVSAASATLALTIDATPPDAPTLALDPASDSGAPGDGITSVATVTVNLAAEDGASVALGDQTAVALGGAATFTVTLAEGVNTLSAVATDAAGNTSAAGVLEVTLDATNAAPLVSALEGTLGEDDNGFDLLEGAQDPDGDALSVAGVPSQVVSQGGRTLMLGDDYLVEVGRLSLTEAGRAQFRALPEGATDRVVFDFSVEDGVNSVANRFTLIIPGVNDIASLGGDLSGSVQEDGTLIASGRIAISDADEGEAAVVPQADVQGVFGAFSVGADGSWRYALNNDLPAVQQLGVDDSVVDRFEVTSLDGSASAAVEITVTGTNDDPTVGPALSLAVTEDGPVATLDPLSGASDVDESDVLTTRNFAGLAAGLRLEGDLVTVDPGDQAFQALAAGEKREIALSWDVIDGNGGVAQQTASIIVTGVNDDPTVGPALSLAVTEDGPVATLDLLAGSSDVDEGDVLTTRNFAGQAAGLRLEGDLVTVDPGDQAFQALAAGEKREIALSWDVIDGNGGVAQQTASIIVTGVNDDPTVGPALSLAVTEDGPVATLDLLAGASDVDAGDVLSVENVAGLTAGLSLDGAVLTVDPADPSFQALPAGEMRVIELSFDVTDGQGGFARQTATVTVMGAADEQAPLVPTIRLSASDAAPSGGTTAARVTLLGETSPGVIVELMSGDGPAVLASALSNVNGSYRLGDVALQLGSTDFRVVARDPETGLTSAPAEVSLTRIATDPSEPVNAALFWNDVALNAIADSGASPDYASRALAMESIAVQNVLTAIDGAPGFLFTFSASGPVDPSAAVAHAAHGVLRSLFPGQEAALDAALAAALAGKVDSTSEALGRAVAERVVAFRANDGAFVEESYVGREGVGEWRPTGPGYLNAANPQWADLRPFLLEDGGQFRRDAPPSLFSDSILGDAYDSDLARIHALGAGDSVERTADQTASARFWAGGAGTVTPPGQWNRIAADVSASEGLSLNQSAELLLKLNLSLADAAIAAWDTKYAYDYWRPVTALNEGGVVDGQVILRDPDWSPLLTTPAHPEYVSGHSTFSAAAATVLTAYFGDGFVFEDSAETTVGPITRQYDSFWEAAEEAGESRVFGGIHFDFSNIAGLALGADVATWVLRSFDPLTDTVAPTIVLTGGLGAAVSASPVIAGFVGDNLSGALQLKAVVDGVEYFTITPDATGAFSFDPGLTDEGRHSVTFIATDAEGNVARLDREFTLHATPPVIALDETSVSDANAALTDGARLSGRIELPEGVSLAALTVQIGAGPVRPISFDSNGGFDVRLEIGRLDVGAHTVTVRAADTAGNATVETIEATLVERPPFTLEKLEPSDREGQIGVTIHPFVSFSRPVDPTTLTEDSFFAVTAAGAKVPGTIALLADGAGAWLLFDSPLPGATAIELVVDGALIRSADGAVLDADGDGAAGGALVQRFTTVSLAGLPETTLVGRVVDPGADLRHGTPDDFVAGPGGVSDYDRHVYRNPIANAEVHVIGRDDLTVFTDENGFFELSGLPAGHVKLVVDGRTATNAPDGVYWPEMVLDVVIRPGQENTIMGGMGPLEAQLERQEDPSFYLPRVPVAALQTVSGNEPVVIRPVTGNGTTLTAEQLDLLTLTVIPGSVIDAKGQVIVDPQIGLAIVPSEMVIDMLPAGVPTPPLFLTIQAPDGSLFLEEAILKVPNVFGLAPGEKTEFFSYDHQTGLLVINGVGTASEDGSYIETDPGSGILQPGWNGPIRVSRITIDPQVLCPPGTSHSSNFEPQPDEITDDLEQLSATDRFIREKYGDIGDESSIFVNNFLSDFYRQAEATIATDLEIMANAKYAGDSGSLGGEVDAGFWAIMGTKLAGDLAETTVKSAANLTPLKLFSTKVQLLALGNLVDYEKSLFDLDFPIEPSRTDNLANRARDVADNGIPGKFGRGDTDKTEPFNELAAEAEQASERIEDLELIWEEQKQQHRDLVDVVEELQDTYGDLLEKIAAGNRPTDAEMELLAGPEGADPRDSDLFELIGRMEQIVSAVETTGTMLGTVYEIYGILQELDQKESDIFGEPSETISISELASPPTQVEGQYVFNYGPVLYVLMTNLDTGEEERFTMRSGESPLQPTSPGANYAISIFDPVSGLTGSGGFTAPRPFVLNSRTNLAELPKVKPILRPEDDSPVGPGGLTEEQARIVGAEFGVADSLLPGSNITDRQALISGLGAAPGAVNLNGVAGILPLDGTAEAVAIGGVQQNGAGMTAYVATGDVGLAVVGVANPTQPVLFGQIDLPDFAEDVATVDRLDLVAVALGSGGLAVVDVSDPVRPTLDALYAGLTVTQVLAVDDRLIIGLNGRISLIDAASGTVITSVGVGVGPEQQFVALAYEDGEIYALGDNGTVHIVTLDQGALTNRGSLDVSDNLRSLEGATIASLDGVLWIGSQSDDFRGGAVTLDISDPDAPSVIAGVDLGNTAGDYLGSALAVNGSGFGVAAQPTSVSAGGASRLQVFSTRDPSDAQTSLTEYRFAGAASDVAIAAGEAFVATGEAGLQVIRFLGIDTQGVAPEITLGALPRDRDDAAPGLQLFQGETVRFDVAASDDIQVRSVDVLLNGTAILSSVAFPWDLTTTLPTIADLGTDQLALQFRATDTGGSVTLTDPIAIQLIEDATPFEIVDVTPEDGASLLPGAIRSLTVTFSKSVESDTVDADSFALSGPAGPVMPTSISVRGGGTQVQLTFAADALGSGAYLLTIDADTVTDRAGTPLAAADVTSSFDVRLIDGQTWISATDGSWNDPVNWASGRPPLPGDDVALPLLAGVTATLSAAAGSVASVGVSGDGAFRVASAESGTDLTTGVLINTGTVNVALGAVAVTTRTANAGELAATSTLGATTFGQPVVFSGELILSGDVANSGTLRAGAGGTIRIEADAIENTGVIRVENLAGSGRSSTLRTSAPLIELTGGGRVELVTDPGVGNRASFSGSVSSADFGVIDERFLNVNNTITGAGDFGVGFVFENAAAGVVEAGAGDVLRITSGRITNSGVMRATDGGALVFDSEQFFFFGGIFAFESPAFIDNRGGLIEADGGFVNFLNSTVSGGRLVGADTAGGLGRFVIGEGDSNGFASLDGTSETLFIDGDFSVAGYLQLRGDIANSGNMLISPGEGPTTVQIMALTDLSGGGRITLNSPDLDFDGGQWVEVIGDYELETDPDSGEQVFDDFGAPIVIYETALTLRDQTLSGSGIVGERLFQRDSEVVPLFEINLFGGGEIDPGAPNQTLEFWNAEINNFGGVIRTGGGVLRLIDSDLFSTSASEIYVDGGELSLEFGDGASIGGFFFNSGGVYVFDGLFYADFTIFNSGEIALYEGVADLSFLIDDASSGGRTLVGDATLILRNGGDVTLDASLGDAEVIVDDSGRFSATLIDFEAGDSIHFTDFDASGPLSIDYQAAGEGGLLTVSDGDATVTLNLLVSNGLTTFTADDFVLSESVYGGVMLETSLL
ncbi:VCBS domain-containing protein [Rubrimonas sp.]|uniref:VCBS domain-containing protein n=1 Tax=Rubrimonas sp. TaxID=2036015 RepID=UPI002FDCFF75